ncbi:Zinc finger protein 821 [Oryzias melastigma]|uniref:Zinc finger protein 821 n=1 Tax=Oryzias melastigma TaxID=30732 RepID=A0A834C7I0_ORYME|nr:Zinc finger protein 821 [Oryzias melastigma]
MSRRKQNNPFKVDWPFHTSGLTGLQNAANMNGRDDFTDDGECLSHNSHGVQGRDSLTEESDSDPDNQGEDSSSNTSADDHMTTKRSQCHLQGAGVKEESEEGGDYINSFVCPLCSLDFSSPDRLISHVYQYVGEPSALLARLDGIFSSTRRTASPTVLSAAARFTDTNNLNREKLKDVLDSCRMDANSVRDSCSMSQSLSSSPMSSPGSGSHPCQEQGPSSSLCQGSGSCHAPELNLSSCHAPRACQQGSGHMTSQCQGPRPCHSSGPTCGPCSGPGPCTGSDQGSSFPSLPDNLLSEGPSLASIPDALSSSSSGLPPIPDILSPMPVYPAGVLLVCNNCVAYQQLMESQSPLRKWALRRKNEPLEARLQRLGA